LHEYAIERSPTFVVILFIFFQVNAYARNGMAYDAIDLYRRIPENTRDTVSHVCVLNACSQSGLVDQGRTIFNRIHTKTEQIICAMVRCFDID
jgi:hypothetical protein